MERKDEENVNEQPEVEIEVHLNVEVEESDEEIDVVGTPPEQRTPPRPADQAIVGPTGELPPLLVDTLMLDLSSLKVAGSGSEATATGTKRKRSKATRRLFSEEDCSTSSLSPCPKRANTGESPEDDMPEYAYPLVSLIETPPMRGSPTFAEGQNAQEGASARTEGAGASATNSDALVDFERRFCDVKLEGCDDPAVRSLLSFENLKVGHDFVNKPDFDEWDLFASLSEMQGATSKGGDAPKTGLTQAQLQTVKYYMENPDRVLAMCWMKNCKNKSRIQKCDVCRLTYCCLHASPPKHGCTIEPAGRPSNFKRPGAHVISARIKRLGHAVVTGEIYPAKCSCDPICTKCKFYFKYIRFFGSNEDNESDSN